MPKLLDKYGVGYMGQRSQASNINKLENDHKKNEEEQMLDMALSIHSKNYTYLKKSKTIVILSIFY